MEKRNCQWCSDVYFLTRRDRLTCSKRCSVSLVHSKKAKKKTRVCINCGDIKSIGLFYRRLKVCKVCWSTNNPEKFVDDTYEGKLIRQFIYKIKAQKWMARENDVIKMMELYELVFDSATISVMKPPEDRYGEMFYKLCMWHWKRKYEKIK